LRRLRVAWSVTSPLGTPVHAEAVAAVRHSVALLQRLGHHTAPAEPEVDGPALARSFISIYFGSVAANVRAACRAGAAEREFEALTRVMACMGRHTSAGALAHQLGQWNGFARGLARLHRQFDLYLTPTLSSPPIRHGVGEPPAWQLGALSALRASGLLGLVAHTPLVDAVVAHIARDSLQHVPFTQLANLTGVAAISLPLHWAADGLPLGVQFHAPLGDEATLLQLAAELEQAQPWFGRTPSG
jgi:amidase